MPVGDDQRQHLELTRDLASGSTARSARRSWCRRPTSRRPGGARDGPAEPDREDVEVGRLAAGHGRAADDPTRSAKKIKSAVTDSGREVGRRAGQAGDLEPPHDLLGRHRPAGPELEIDYDGKGYGDFKSDLAEALIEFVRPRPGALPRADRRPGGDRAHPAGGRRPRADDRGEDARGGLRPGRVPPARLTRLEVIRTERLVLRPFVPDDLDALGRGRSPIPRSCATSGKGEARGRTRDESERTLRNDPRRIRAQWGHGLWAVTTPGRERRESRSAGAA